MGDVKVPAINEFRGHVDSQMPERLECSGSGYWTPHAFEDGVRVRAQFIRADVVDARVAAAVEAERERVLLAVLVPLGAPEEGAFTVESAIRFLETLISLNEGTARDVEREACIAELLGLIDGFDHIEICNDPDIGTMVATVRDCVALIRARGAKEVWDG